MGFSWLARSGSGESESLDFSFTLARQPAPWRLETSAFAHRAETEGETTAERLFGSLRGERALVERCEFFAPFSCGQDEFAGFDSRLVSDAGAQGD